MQSAPPAGWYPDSSGQQGLRWWDGAQWGPQAPPSPVLAPTAPAGPLPPVMAAPAPWAGPAGSPVPWAWGVAAMPVIQLVIGVGLGLSVGVSVGGPAAVFAGVLAAAALGIFMAVRDARALRAAGETFPSGLAAWCLLGGWAYLLARAIKRANRTNSDWVLFGVSVVTWLVVIVIMTPMINAAITSGSVFNRAKVQSNIARGIYNQTGMPVTVNCPQDPPISPGSQFQCVATASYGSTSMVTVTIQDNTGDFTWQVTG